MDPSIPERDSSSAHACRERTFELSLDMLAVAASAGGKWLQVNPALCATLGWHPDELLETSLLEFVHPDERDDLARKLSGSPVGGVEQRFRCNDSNYKLISWNIVPDPASGTTHLSGRDVTERGRADDLLRAQNLALEGVAAPLSLHEALTFLTHIIEEQSGHSAVAGLMLVDADGSHLRSFAGSGLASWYHAEIDGVPIERGLATCPSAAAANAAVFTSDIANDPSWAPWAHLALKQGLKAAWAMPIRGSDGRVLGTLGTYFREPRLPSEWERQLVEGLCHCAAWRIERDQAESALRASEEQLRNATEAAEVGTWRFDPRTGMDTRDACLNRIIGLDDWGTSTQPVADSFSRIHPDDRPRTKTAGVATLAGEDLYDVEARVLRPTGEERWIRIRGRLIHDAVGEPLYWTGAVADMTEQILATHAMREHDERKDQFLAILGHELRNPLAPLRIGVELLGSALSAERLASVQAMMGRQIRQLVRLADDLLDVSRISRGRVELKRSCFDLHDVVEAATELSRPLIDERGHTLLLADTATPLPVDGDLERLTQVVGNLLTNAAKYMDRGGTIRVLTAIDDDQAVLQVRDTGYGIPSESFAALFEMFNQVPAHLELTGGGGLGIGLALSRQLVELHGGTLEAASDGLRCGSEFSVRLPLAEWTLDEQSDEPEAPPTVSRRILVVDDHVDAATTLCHALETSGMEVAMAHDGPMALEIIDGFAPEVVLLDIGLPGMDGYQVARKIRDRSAGKAATLIAVTGWGDAEHQQRARAAGFDDHLIKPVTTDRLLRLIAADSTSRA